MASWRVRLLPWALHSRRLAGSPRWVRFLRRVDLRRPHDQRQRSQSAGGRWPCVAGNAPAPRSNIRCRKATCHRVAGGRRRRTAGCLGHGVRQSRRRLRVQHHGHHQRPRRVRPRAILGASVRRGPRRPRHRRVRELLDGRGPGPCPAGLWRPASPSRSMPASIAEGSGNITPTRSPSASTSSQAGRADRGVGLAPMPLFRRSEHATTSHTGVVGHDKQSCGEAVPVRV